MQAHLSIGVCDESPVICAGLRGYFDSVEGHQIVFSCQRHPDLMPLMGQHHTDVVIMDIVAEGGGGLEACSLVRRAYPAAILVGFSNTTNVTLISHAYASGIHAFVSKAEPLDHLCKAVSHVRDQGRQYVPDHHRLLLRAVDDPITLSAREKSVLGHIIAGYSTKQIADLECLSEHTVDFHRRALFRKFGVGNVAELVREGIDFGYKGRCGQNYGKP